MNFSSYQKEFEAFLLDLSSRSNGKIYYVPNEGNAGDALIAAGMWCLFDRLKIEPIVVATELLPAGAHVVYAGGGNLIDSYDNCRCFLERCLDIGVAECVVLPHTVRGHFDVLKRLDKRFTVFCREDESYLWLVKQNIDFNVMRAQDLAFNLELNWLRSRSFRAHVGFYQYLIRKPKQLLRYLRWIFKKGLLRLKEDCVIEIFRSDIESTSLKSRVPFSDLSNHYGSEYLSKDEAIAIAYEFLNKIDEACGVDTNRLHAAIGGVLLGKKVTLRDNSYGKNRSIYYASLKENERVRFVEVAK